VEIASRCCRVWVDEDTLDTPAVLLAERIIRGGVTLLPHDPYMAIWWSSFLIDVQGSYQSGYTALQACGLYVACSAVPSQWHLLLY
jgi:hypothetical protein